MTTSATRIIQENPNIQNFTLQYTQDRWPTLSGGRLKQMGIYSTVYDEYGNALAVQALERKPKAFGGSEASRRFVHNISAKLPASPGWDSRSPRSSISSDARSWHRRSGSQTSFIVF
jgi:hypothetical protein